MARTKMFPITDMVVKMKPVWEKHILDLGYTKKQAAAFAEGYAADLATLSDLGQMFALKQRVTRCMRAGYKAAGIDEDEARDRTSTSKEPNNTPARAGTAKDIYASEEIEE